jgi:hypothetical protein
MEGYDFTSTKKTKNTSKKDTKKWQTRKTLLTQFTLA